jgi:hypothetical protein
MSALTTTDEDRRTRDRTREGAEAAEAERNLSVAA